MVMVMITATSIIRPTALRNYLNKVVTFAFSNCAWEAPGDDNANNNDNESIRQQNKSLSKLIRAGHIHDARRLFDGLLYRNVVTWNSMISGYVQQRELAKARKLFDDMPKRDVVSWNSMLLGYTFSKDPAELAEGRRLFDEMPERDTVSWNTMIRGYTRNRRMADAMLLFKRMPERNAISWNTMITGFLEDGSIAEAVQMFEMVPTRDSTSLSAVVSGLVQNGRLKDAESVLVKTWRMGETEAIIDAYNTLIAGYGKYGKVEEARRLFDLIPDRPHRAEEKENSTRGVSRNIITWNSMMMCYIKAGDVAAARKLFDKMPKRDLFSWNTIISGYVHAQDIQEAASLFQEMRNPDGRTWNFMISGFAQMGDIEQARNYFDHMPSKNIVSWNAMIAGYEKNDEGEGAIKLFTKMRAAGERPDRHTLSSVLGACAGLTSLVLGTQVHQVITKTFIADIPINNSLITMYARCGNLKEARSIFDSMEMQRDFISWNAMIGGYAQHGLAAETLKLFKDMLRTKLRPTHITFISVLSACCHSGLLTEGQKLFKCMVHDFGIMPGVEHYALLVNLIGRHGQIEEARHVIDSMLVPPDKSVWGALLDACKVHNNCDMARIAADALMEVDPDSGGPYVLLYNMYADMGRWEDAYRVREVLDRSGIRKQPGYSWIELQGSLHNFVAGDRSHHLASEIYYLIETYEKITRDEHPEDIEIDILKFDGT